MINTKTENEIYRRVEELMYKIYPTLNNYSKTERYLLCTRIKDTFYDLLKSFIEKELNLRTNINKAKIFPINQGVNVVGFKIYSTHRLLRNDSKKKIKRKSNKMGQLILEGRMTVERAEQILNSWFGHAKNCCSYNFIKRLLFKNPYIYMSEENSLKININKIKKEGDLGVV